MIRPPERPEIPEEEHPRERIAQLLAVAIVIAALGVALVEFLHEFDGRHADAAGVEAQKLAIQEQGAVVRGEEKAQLQLDTYALTEEQRTRSANSFQQSINTTDGSAQAQFLSDEQSRWTQLAGLSGGFTTITPSGPTGPQKDIAFPNLVITQQQHDAYVLDAQQDAAKAERQAWQTRLGRYAVIITFFAIAGVLFGLALTLSSGVRRGMAGLGAVLLAAGVVWTGALQLSRPSTPSDKAADEYAAGIVAHNSAYTQNVDQGLRDADAHLSKAIELRPDFAQAYVDRSSVRFDLGSPQPNDPLASITTADGLKAQGDDLQKAYDLGLRTKDLLNNLGFNRLSLAIANKQPLYDQARGYIDQAITLDDSDPVLYYNRALSYLGGGQVESARAAYHEAVDHTVYSNVATKTPSRNTGRQEDLVTGALTDLTLLADHRSDLSAQVTEMKQLVVDGVQRPTGGPSKQLNVGALKLLVFPGELWWEGTVPGLDLNGDTVSTQWYHQDPQRLGWSGIPAVSGALAPVALGSNPNDYILKTKYLTSTNRCLDPGRYRVEVYIDGRLAGQVEADATFGGLEAATLRDLGVAVCNPAGWIVLAESSNPDLAKLVQLGFDAGYVSADNSRGVYLFRYQNPGQKGSSADVLASSLRVGTMSAFASLFPAAPQLSQASIVTGFLGLDGGAADRYTYSGGEAVVGSGVPKDGSVIVCVVFGPTDFMENGAGIDVFNSIVTVPET